MREWKTEEERRSCINKAVFEERGYFIVNINDCSVFKTPFTTSYRSLLLHKCSSTTGVYNHTSHMHPSGYNVDATSKKCSVCNIWIPESVHTLWVLQNADCLNTDGDAGYR